jgi:hypothetical protein
LNVISGSVTLLVRDAECRLGLLFTSCGGEIPLPGTDRPNFSVVSM